MRKEAACSEMEEGMEKVPAAMREYVAATDSVSKGGAPVRRAKIMQPRDQTSEAGL